MRMSFLAFVFAASATIVTMAARPGWQIEIPGADPAALSVYDVSQTGIAVGQTFLSDDYQAFLVRRGSSPVFFGYPGARTTVPTAVNAGGTVAGFYFLPDESVPYAFIRRRNGEFKEVVVPATTGHDVVPTSINAAGTVVGIFVTPNDDAIEGFVLRNDNFSAFSCGRFWTEPSDIANNGTIVGTCLDYVDFDQTEAHGFIFYNGAVTELDYPGSVYGTTHLFGVAPNGLVIGAATLSGGTPQWFTYHRGAFQPIAEPPGEVIAISSSGVVTLLRDQTVTYWRIIK